MSVQKLNRKGLLRWTNAPATSEGKRRLSIQRCACFPSAEILDRPDFQYIRSPLVRTTSVFFPCPDKQNKPPKKKPTRRRYPCLASAASPSKNHHHHCKLHESLFACSFSTIPATALQYYDRLPVEGRREVLLLLLIGEVDTLALQSKAFGGGSVAVAPQMAQPNAEPVEEYEYVLPRIALLCASS